jgi:hypothetical protein
MSCPTPEANVQNALTETLQAGDYPTKAEQKSQSYVLTEEPPVS